MHKKTFNDLQKRAIQLLKKCRLPKAIPNQLVSQLIDDLTTYQIELEIQNEDLLKTQIKLEESHTKYIELYDLAPVGYFSINKEGIIKEVNQAGCDLLGLKKHTLLNRCFSRFIIPEQQGLFSQYRNRAFKELSKLSFEIKLLRWTQPTFHALIECKVVQNSSTGFQQLLTFVSDISARKIEEASLHQHRAKMASLDRLRSLNEFMYGMAQEQNRSLTLMNNYLQGCIKRLENGNCQINEFLPILNKISNQTRILTDVILNRRTVASKCSFHFEYDNINTIINQSIKLLTHEFFDYPVIIQYEAIENISRVKLDKLHIQQVIMNLARNAIEAMRDSHIIEPKLLIETAQPNVNTIEITLFDNGPGLSQELIPKLFEPHFTTKSYGIGLGLTVSRAIIEKHGGHLLALSNPSGGACFKFTLPVTLPFN